MERFKCLVIGDDLELQLTPYSETTTDKRFLKFFDAKKELRKDYETFVIPETHYTRLKTPFGAGLTLKEYYKSMPKALREWYSIEFDEECGTYGYWFNPNAKWNKCYLIKNTIDKDDLPNISAIVRRYEWIDSPYINHEKAKEADFSAWQETLFNIIKNQSKNELLSLVECRI